MNQGVASAAASAFLLLAAGGASAATGFRFHVPDGWVDLSPGAPADNFDQVPGEAARLARSHKFVALAYDMAGRSGRFATNLNVDVQQAVLPISERKLAKIQAEYERATATGGYPVHVVDASIRNIQGVPAARLVSDVRMMGSELRQVVYLIPGYKETAAMTFTTERSRFDQYIAIFDATAERTEGVRAPPPMLLGFDLREMLRAGLIGGLIGGCVAFVRGLIRRKAA